MAGHLTPAPGLDVTIAQRFARPAVARVLDMLLDEAKARAPQTRVWVTSRDERVRPTHVEADSQVVPDNLRFILNKVGGQPGHDLARHPRDPALPAAQAINCRCDDPTVGDFLRESLHASDVDVTGTRVSGQVYTDFDRAAESENGTDEDTAAHYMAGALQEVAARLRAGRSR